MALPFTSRRGWGFCRCTGNAREGEAYLVETPQDRDPYLTVGGSGEYKFGGPLHHD